jgi:hypothetical protein
MVVAFVISFIGSPQYVGWSIAFVMLILFTSVTPAAKYILTLDYDRGDQVLSVVSLGLHLAFFSLLGGSPIHCCLFDVLIDRWCADGSHSWTSIERLVMWSLCALYPAVLLLTTSIIVIRSEGYKTTTFFAGSCVLFVVVASGVLIAIYAILSATASILLTVGMILLLLLVALTIHWMRSRFILTSIYTVTSHTSQSIPFIL